MLDRYGREIDYLRISVTDRCNFRCRYCRPPEGPELAAAKEILSFEETLTVAKIATGLGIDRIRLTGGEPLLRREITKLVRMLREGCNLKDLSLSTNGSLLAYQAQELAMSGLDRVNVSLDSLNSLKFRWITRGGELEQVLKGIDRAIEVGLEPVKINTVMMKGFNDDEAVDLARLTLERELIVRFIELMPIGEANSNDFWGSAYLSLQDVKHVLEEEFDLLPAEVSQGSGPARYYRIRGAVGKIGFITPLSASYCESCNRIRLTAKGALRPCLALDHQISLKHPLREGRLEEVERLLRESIWGKPKSHRWNHGRVTVDAISGIGG